MTKCWGAVRRVPTVAASPRLAIFRDSRTMDVASQYHYETCGRRSSPPAFILRNRFGPASAGDHSSARGTNSGERFHPAGPEKDTAQSGPAQAPTPPDYSQQAYVVQHFSESMRFENDGTGSDQTDARSRSSARAACRRWDS